MENTTFEIRIEQPADKQAVRGVHLAAFPSAVEADLVDELRAAGRLEVSIVVTIDQIVVGHCALSPIAVHGSELTAKGLEPALGLGPVAVLPSWQNRGIGAEMIRRSLALCRERRVGFVVVLGDPRYYARFGFAPASHWRLLDEFGGGEAFQAIQLQPGAIPEAGGRVQYAAEFDKFKS